MGQVKDIGRALAETIVFLIRVRLPSPTTWVVIIASYEFHYAITHQFPAPQMGVVGATVILAVAAYIWGQLQEGRRGAGRTGDQ